MIEVRESYVNETDGHLIGDSGWYQPYTEHLGELFRAMRREYGRCTSKIYVDAPVGKVKPVGWYFQKKDRYTDTGETYLRGVWVEYRTVTVEQEKGA